MRIQHPYNTHGARLLYNSDSYVAFDRRKHIIMCFCDNRLLFIATVTGTIFDYKRTKHFSNFFSKTELKSIKT